VLFLLTRLSPNVIGSTFSSYLPYIVVELNVISHLFSPTLYFKNYSHRKPIHNRIKELCSMGLGHRKIHKTLIKEGFKIGRFPSCVHSMIKKIDRRKKILSQKTEIEIVKVEVKVFRG